MPIRQRLPNINPPTENVYKTPPWERGVSLFDGVPLERQHRRDHPVDERADRAEPLKADEVDAQIDCSKRTTLRRLDELAKDGPLESKEDGARARVWWLPIPRNETDTDSDN